MKKIVGAHERTMGFPTLCLIASCLCFVGVLSEKRAIDEEDAAPVWSSDSNENVANSVVVPDLSPRANDELSDNDRILQIFNNCECVIYYLCDDDNYINTDGKGLISPR